MTNFICKTNKIFYLFLKEKFYQIFNAEIINRLNRMRRIKSHRERINEDHFKALSEFNSKFAHLPDISKIISVRKYKPKKLSRFDIELMQELSKPKDINKIIVL